MRDLCMSLLRIQRLFIRHRLLIPKFGVPSSSHFFGVLIIKQLTITDMKDCLENDIDWHSNILYTQDSPKLFAFMEIRFQQVAENVVHKLSPKYCIAFLKLYLKILKNTIGHYTHNGHGTKVKL